jgi:hypothetical protein
MPDEADELILKMRHLEVAAREQENSRASRQGAEQLKTKAQKMALEARAELTAAEQALAAAEAKQAKARDPTTPPLDAADLLLAGKAEAQQARTRAVKARARLNFALDKMDEAERREWESFHAEGRAEAHAQLAEDPLSKKP